MSEVSTVKAGRGVAASKGLVWTGRVLSALAILFLGFDGVAKLFKPAPVVEAFVRLGIPISLSVGIGMLLLVCTLIYAIPKTAVLGALLLTAYLGGAVAIHMRSGSTKFEMFFPVIFGAVVWAGIFLRERRLRDVLPLRRQDPD